MKSKTLICAIAAASFSFASLSFAQTYDRSGPGRDGPRGEQRSPTGRDGNDSDHRGFDQRDNRHGPGYGPRGPDPRAGYNNYGRDDRQRGFERHDARGNPYYGARGPQFHRGGRIPAEYRNRQYVVNNWQPHHLSAPPRGHQWVQVGADYALIAIATGIIAQLVLSQ
ncbi:MAG: hypothetical protein JWR60_1392 [Polaromonas sp.]|nr:hypothetical protein [Polaromonas sp.]